MSRDALARAEQVFALGGGFEEHAPMLTFGAAGPGVLPAVQYGSSNSRVGFVAPGTRSFDEKSRV